MSRDQYVKETQAISSKIDRDAEAIWTRTLNELQALGERGKGAYDVAARPYPEQSTCSLAKRKSDDTHSVRRL